ncbi:MAG: hypothetical protein DSM106950_19330 [Stigonema ocellatum SAG 48.90 = DSM 106950]|nr:hypothetical protein [Stigonema ocellatum SAG 48.90 = DSM 106950]
MVERPIKKSERQSKVSTDNNSENLDSMPPVESSPKISKRNDDRSSGRGKKASFGDESKQQVNPALARPPKPVKPRPSAIVETEPDSEPISGEPQGETAEE